jgi:oligoendopeptidase F
MGHAMHTYYSGKNQPHIYANYRIFVAEVASTCNEVMLIKWLLDNCDDDRRELYLLNHYLEQFRGTLFRQTMFAEFEKLTHGMCQNGEPINLQSLNRIYHGLNEKYFGPDMVVDSEVDQEWSRIPHFYNPFYVYQYATGFSAAIAIANGIMKGNEAVRAGYREFLSGGCMLHPLELLKLCGVDMESGEPVQAAMETFKELLCCMERKLDTAAKEMG